jgi:hypothetical protein
MTLQDIDSTSTGLSDSAIIGTSLYVSWQPPRVDTANGRPDIVGSGAGSRSTVSTLQWLKSMLKLLQASGGRVQQVCSLDLSGF